MGQRQERSVTSHRGRLARPGTYLWNALSAGSVLYWLASLFGGGLLAAAGALVSDLSHLELPTLWSLIGLVSLFRLGFTVTLSLLTEGSRDREGYGELDREREDDEEETQADLDEDDDQDDDEDGSVELDNRPSPRRTAPIATVSGGGVSAGSAREALESHIDAGEALLARLSGSSTLLHLGDPEEEVALWTSRARRLIRQLVSPDAAREFVRRRSVFEGFSITTMVLPQQRLRQELERKIALLSETVNTFRPSPSQKLSA